MNPREERINPFRSDVWRVGAGATFVLIYILVFGQERAKAILEVSLAQRETRK
jgi:hypothetical protein